MGIIQAIKQNILLHSSPTQQSFSMLCDDLLQSAARQNVRLLFSGFGGDEGVSSRMSGVFSSIADARNWKLLLSELRAYYKSSGRLAFLALLRYLLLRISSASEKKIKTIRNGRVSWESFIDGLAISEDFFGEMDFRQRFVEEKRKEPANDQRERMKHRFEANYVSQRLEYSYIDAASRGIQYSYPLLDRELLQYYYSLPLEYKFRMGQGRAIFREALKDVLPEEIRLRRDKSKMTIPNVYQRLIFDHDEIRNLILEGKSENKYHYLNYDKMLKWQFELENRKKGDRRNLYPAAFINSLQVLMLQQMQRTGVFISGIRC